MVHNPNEAKANFVEHSQGSKVKKAKGKGTKLGPKGGVSKKLKFRLWVDCRRETNTRKRIWLMASVRMCMT